MKITKITIDNKKASQTKLNTLVKALDKALSKAGYITDIKIVNSSRIDLGMHMKSFVINTIKLGYNTRYSPHFSTRRTSVPCWEQRVDYNNIVNKVLDKHKVSANVKSGDFTIRQATESMNEHDWYDQKPYWMIENENKGYYIEKGYVC